MTQVYKIQLSMNQAHVVESGFVFKQGDFGFQIEIEVLDFNVTGSTPQIIFRKASGAVESTTITVSGNKYTYTIRGTELDTPGPAICDLKLKNSTTQRISTASFRYFVEADTMDGLHQQANSYSDTIAQIVGQYEDDVATINYNIAPAYDSTSTYNVGDYVIYNDTLYRCKEAISTAEAWNAAHWTQAELSLETAEIKDDLTNITNCKILKDWSVTGKYIKTGSPYAVGDVIPLTPSTISGNYRYQIVDASENDVFIVNGSAGSAVMLWSFVDSENRLLSRSGGSVTANNLKLVAPANASKLILNTNTIAVDSYKGIPVSILTTQSEYLTQLTKTGDIGTGEIRDVTEQNGYLTISGTYTGTSTTHSKSATKIPCKEGDIFAFKGRSGSIAYAILYYTDNTVISGDHLESADKFTKIVIPQNCNYVTFSSQRPTAETVVFELYKLSPVEADLIDGKFTYGVSPLNGKKWVAYGDSFTHGDFSGLQTSEYTFEDGSYKVYPNYIKRRTTCNVVNNAVNGSTMKDFVQQETYLDIPENADYATFYFGINDSHASFAVGTIDDNTDATFYGCLNILMNWLIVNRPNTKVGFIISNGCDTTDYPTAEINACEKWGIAYLDINGDKKLPMVIRANMRGLSETVYDLYLQKYACVYSGDSQNHHPNPLGHYDESFMIQQFLERL